ncbi:polysaccharide biosynthesis/export family protein [Luteolibacter flavescens]|uniref:Polysaccharide biosynthesis/export family protein n=1 Tax=Luteolibacter flavescens TaxID=1859460 RepID=A0ABT3FVG8_9BACT|nr:polysaccharide biosynthesis/export family protein [Luteolibacter flavescens]MCW1887309.1 polysaccharide biosynthesis/export family protein [Luteolibacter flavescens]
MNFPLLTRWKTLVSIFFTVAAAAVSTGAEDDPVLKQDDLIRMSVFEEPDLDANTRVMRSGSIALPLIGDVPVAGLTVSEANKRIRELYISEEYLVDPKVTLTVEEYSKDFVSVIGSVRSPGEFALPQNRKYDLSAALAAAGGLSPEADLNGIVVTRADGKQSTHSSASLQGGGMVPLYPGDRVRVDQSPYVNKSVKVLGQVRKAGPVAFPLDGRLDIVSAIAGAGGYTELANEKKVNVNRKGKVTSLNVKEMTDRGEKPYFLLPDDIVTVTERMW